MRVGLLTVKSSILFLRGSRWQIIVGYENIHIYLRFIKKIEL